jgi:hypothetical protein
MPTLPAKVLREDISAHFCPDISTFDGVLGACETTTVCAEIWRSFWEVVTLFVVMTDIGGAEKSPRQAASLENLYLRILISPY